MTSIQWFAAAMLLLNWLLLIRSANGLETRVDDIERRLGPKPIQRPQERPLDPYQLLLYREWRDSFRG